MDCRIVYTSEDIGGRPEKLRIVVAGGPRLCLSVTRSTAVEVIGGKVVGEASDWATLRSVADELRPEVVMALLPFEGLDEPAQVLSLRETHPELAYVLLLTSPARQDLAPVASLVGRPGIALVSANSEAADVRYAVLGVARGFSIISPHLAIAITEHVSPRWPRLIQANPELSAREVEILAMLSQGEREASIADALGVGVRTVETYITKAREKLRAANRTHAVALAMAQGIITASAIRAVDDANDLMNNQG